MASGSVAGAGWSNLKESVIVGIDTINYVIVRDSDLEFAVPLAM